MSGPTPLWYTTRGAGFVVMILLTASVVLGIMTNGRWSTAGIPRFVTNALHRNLSLVALVFLVLHIITAILDSFAHLGLKDALIPFASSYRPLWMGLGVLSAELFAAIVITSLVRGLLGYGAWRVVHALSYVSWPFALLHGIGTGSDTRAWWAMVINFACVGAVFFALVWRIAAVAGTRSRWHARLAWGSAAGTVALVAFIVLGPLQPGWALAAGTPRDLLHGTSSSSTATSSYTLPAGLRDQLTGTVQQASNGSAVLILTDTRDPAIKVTITLSDPQANTVTVEVVHNVQSLCTAQVTVTLGLNAPCGSTQLNVQRLFEGADGSVSALLVTA